MWALSYQKYYSILNSNWSKIATLSPAKLYSALLTGFPQCLYLKNRVLLTYHPAIVSVWCFQYYLNDFSRWIDIVIPISVLPRRHLLPNCAIYKSMNTLNFLQNRDKERATSSLDWTKHAPSRFIENIQHCEKERQTISRTLIIGTFCFCPTF